MVDIYRHERRLWEIINTVDPQSDEGHALMEEVEDLSARMEDGCVMRSLESAFQAETTQQQWTQWFSFLKRNDVYFNQLLNLGIPREDIQEMVRDALSDFISYTLTPSKTPLGASLRKYELERLRGPFQSVLESLDKGYLVLMPFRIPTGPHLAHVARVNNEVVRVSDDLSPVKYSPTRLCDAYIFKPILDNKS